MLSLSKDYSRIELEQACEVIVATSQVPSVRKIKDLLAEHRKHPQQESVTDPGVSTTPLSTGPRRSSPPEPGTAADNPNIRGVGAFVFKEVD